MKYYFVLEFPKENNSTLCYKTTSQQGRFTIALIDIKIKSEFSNILNNLLKKNNK
mgnify:CR=1 FL=1